MSFLSRNVFCPGVPLMQSRAFSFQYVLLCIFLVGLFLYVNYLKLSEEKYNVCHSCLVLTFAYILQARRTPSESTGERFISLVHLSF